MKILSYKKYICNRTKKTSRRKLKWLAKTKKRRLGIKLFHYIPKTKKCAREK